MGTKQSKNVLLSSLEEIKASSHEDQPRDPENPSGPAALDGSGLLGSLLAEVREEADREVQEISRVIEERSVLEKQLREDEEHKKREEYDRLIKAESQRRRNIIRSKEDERVRREAELKEQELKKQGAVQALQRRQRRRHIAIGSSLALAMAVLTFAGLVATNVIELGEKPRENPPPPFEPLAAKQTLAPTTPAAMEIPAEPEPVVLDPGEITVAFSPPHPVLEEEQYKLDFSIDPEDSVRLLGRIGQSIPTLSSRHADLVDRAVQRDIEAMEKALAEAQATGETKKYDSGGSTGRGGSDGEDGKDGDGGLVINTDVFGSKKDKKKDKKNK